MTTDRSEKTTVAARKEGQVTRYGVARRLMVFTVCGCGCGFGFAALPWLLPLNFAGTIFWDTIWDKVGKFSNILHHPALRLVYGHQPSPSTPNEATCKAVISMFVVVAQWTLIGLCTGFASLLFWHPRGRQAKQTTT